MMANIEMIEASGNVKDTHVPKFGEFVLRGHVHAYITHSPSCVHNNSKYKALVKGCQYVCVCVCVCVWCVRMLSSVPGDVATHS
jgi:hypothetical protein